MYLAGIPIPDDVRELARLVEEPTDAVLEKALEPGTVIVALSIVDRERILLALDDPQTTPLAELRRHLLREREWRVREGRRQRSLLPIAGPDVTTIDDVYIVDTLPPPSGGARNLRPWLSLPALPR
jgi:hypothetical protein